MKLSPISTDPELIALLKRSAEAVAAMSPAEKAEMNLRQRISWVRGETGISHPEWSDQQLDEALSTLPEAWALSEIDRLRSSLADVIAAADHALKFIPPNHGDYTDDQIDLLRKAVAKAKGTKK